MYCELGDLLLGAVGSTLPVEVDPIKYIKNAAGEIDARLGFQYLTPIEVTELPHPQQELLKSINSKRASGRMIMALAIHAEDSAVHAYALRLLSEADLELAAIANGDVKLTAPRVNEDGNPAEESVDPAELDPLARVPGSVVRDVISATAAFEQTVMQGAFAPWRPNDGREYGPFRGVPRGDG